MLQYYKCITILLYTYIINIFYNYLAIFFSLFYNPASKGNSPNIMYVIHRNKTIARFYFVIKLKFKSEK